MSLPCLRYGTLTQATYQISTASTCCRQPQVCTRASAYTPTKNQVFSREPTEEKNKVLPYFQKAEHRHLLWSKREGTWLGMEGWHRHPHDKCGRSACHSPCTRKSYSTIACPEARQYSKDSHVPRITWAADPPVPNLIHYSPHQRKRDRRPVDAPKPVMYRHLP